MRKIWATIALLGLATCTTTANMNWVFVGGSKADGEVTLGIDVQPVMGVTETNVIWDANQANAEATKRCQNWGYSGAEVYREGEFPVLKTCFPQGISPCWSKSYRVQYQCTGSKAQTPS